MSRQGIDDTTIRLPDALALEGLPWKTSQQQPGTRYCRRSKFLFRHVLDPLYGGYYVSFSPALRGGHNFRTIARKELVADLKRLARFISVPAKALRPATLHRLDLFRDLELPRHWADYDGVRQLIRPRCQLQSLGFLGTWYFKNNRRTIRLYEKIAQLRRRRELAGKYPAVLRVETSFRARGIRGLLGIHTVRDLLRRFKRLDRRHGRLLLRDVFWDPSPPPMIDPARVVAETNRLLAAEGSGHKDFQRMQFLVAALTTSHVSPSDWRQWLLDKGYTSGYARQIRRELEKLHGELDLPAEVAAEGAYPLALYTELRDRIRANRRVEGQALSLEGGKCKLRIRQVGPKRPKARSGPSRTPAGKP